MAAPKQVTGMHLTVEKAAFLTEVALVRSAAEKKTTLPILGMVLLEAHGDALTMTATDLEISIRSTCPAKVKREGSGTIPAHKLAAYVKLLPEGDVSVRFDDIHWAAMNGGKNRAKIAGMSRESFPELPAMPEPIAEIPAALFCSMIARTSFAVSAEESRFTLNGALLLLADSSITMVATDGHRLGFTRKDLGPDAFQEPLKLLIPKRAMAEIQKLSADAVEGAMIQIARDSNNLYFQIGHRLLITRQVTGNFPDYGRVLPSVEAHLAQVDRAELQAAIARVAEFADGRSHAMRVQLSSEGVRVSTSCLEMGESEEQVACDYSGPNIEIGFNAQYVMEFLSVCPSKRVEIRIADEKSAGEFRPEVMEGRESYRYVVMPMRV